MQNKLKIVENFLNKSDFDKLYALSMNTEWTIQSSTIDQLTFLYSEKTNDNFFNNYLYNMVLAHLEKNNYKLDRVYFNGQWNGREGSIHNDECDFTALLYLSPYEYGWGGFTEIFTETNPVLVHPYPNRLMIFNGLLSHKAYSFVYQQCPLRITLAFKINLK